MYHPTGDSTPTLKQLQKADVIVDVSSRWYELGIELLDDDQVGRLEVIKADNDEVTRRCSAMLNYWLQTHPKATWLQLVTALRERGVEMNKVADKLERTFTGRPHESYCLYCLYGVYNDQVCRVAKKAGCHILSM